MINRVRLTQPAWHLTFPHRVVPMPDEWLPGVMLRCDEANHWGSETTFSQILHPHDDISHKKLLTDMSHLVVPSVLRLDHLSELLAVPCAPLLPRPISLNWFASSVAHSHPLNTWASRIRFACVLSVLLNTGCSRVRWSFLTSPAVLSTR